MVVSLPFLLPRRWTMFKLAAERIVFSHSWSKMLRKVEISIIGDVYTWVSEDN